MSFEGRSQSVLPLSPQLSRGSGEALALNQPRLVKNLPHCLPCESAAQFSVSF